MDFTDSLKGFIFKAFIVFFSLCTLLWLSIIFYGLLYYLYIPAVAHVRAVHLQYDMSCFKENHCHHPKFPFDNITLIENGNEFLRSGQGYAIELVLEMPESERNWNQGIFMIKLDMINFDGKLVKSSRRSAMLRYRTHLFKILYTIFFLPGLLAGSFEEKQSLIIPLFENFVEECYNNAYFAYIEIQAQSIEVYTSTLRIHAQFTGLRYLMYYWPVLSAVVGVGMNFLFLVTTVGLIWFYESTKTSNSEMATGESSHTFMRFLSRKRTIGSRNLFETNVPCSVRETFETESDGEELPNGEDSQSDRETPEIQREPISIENIPRHRVVSSELREN